MTTTRRQHHVWRSYLGAWSIGGQIHCLQDGRIFQTNPTNAAVQRDFYKLHALTDADIRGIREMFRECSPAAKQTLEGFIGMFGGYGRLKANLQRHGIDAPEIAAILDRQMITAEEDWHAQLEASVAPVFEAIRRKDLSFYSDPQRCGQFAHFLALQSLRTKGLKERVLARAAERHGFSTERCWNVVSQMMAVNVGGTLLAQRHSRPLVLLENATDTPFVTGDQPVINLLHARDTGGPPTLLALCCPVSPWLAVVLDEVAERSRYAETVSAEQVDKLNREIVAAAHKQVFGNSREVLQPLVRKP